MNVKKLLSDNKNTINALLAGVIFLVIFIILFQNDDVPTSTMVGIWVVFLSMVALSGLNMFLFYKKNQPVYEEQFE